MLELPLLKLDLIPTVTKGKGQLPKTSGWYFAAFLFLMLLLFHVTVNALSFSRVSKSNKKTTNATGDVVQADTDNVNQPRPVITLNDDANQPRPVISLNDDANQPRPVISLNDNVNQPRPVVALNDYNEYATNLL
jgi:hypothetical protein